MNRNVIITASLLFLMSCGHSKQDVNDKGKENTDQVKSGGPMTNYLQVPGPIKYDKTYFNFSFSSLPFENYFRQQYLPGGELPEHFNQMIMVELALRDLPLRDIAQDKISELEARKKTDPVAKYFVTENTKTEELLLDFTVSDHITDENAVVEWTVYRYHLYSDASGKKGIMAFALVKHAYGQDCKSFVDDLNANRQKYIDAFAALDYPRAELKEPK